MTENHMQTGSKVHITGRRRKMGFDTYEGIVEDVKLPNGHIIGQVKTACDIPTEDLERMDDRSLLTFVKRSLRSSAEYDQAQKV